MARTAGRGVKSDVGIGFDGTEVFAIEGEASAVRAPPQAVGDAELDSRHREAVGEVAEAPVGDGGRAAVAVANMDVPVLDERDRFAVSRPGASLVTVGEGESRHDARLAVVVPLDAIDASVAIEVKRFVVDPLGVGKLADDQSVDLRGPRCAPERLRVEADDAPPVASVFDHESGAVFAAFHEAEVVAVGEPLQSRHTAG